MDELNSHARRLIESANSYDEPTDADRDRVRAGVLMRVGSVAAVGTVAITAAKASSAAASAGPLLASTLTSAAIFSGAAVKIGAVVVIGALASAGAYVAFRPAHAPAPAAVVAQSPVAVAAPVVAVAPQAAVDATPAAVDLADLPTDDAKPSPAHGHPRTASLEGEMTLLRQADAALRRGDSAAALVAINKDAALYPTGALSQEREGVRAIALCSAGNVNQGQAAAKRFLASASKSPLSSRIRSACSISE